jgi:hypothetical protein
VRKKNVTFNLNGLSHQFVDQIVNVTKVDFSPFDKSQTNYPFVLFFRWKWPLLEIGRFRRLIKLWWWQMVNFIDESLRSGILNLFLLHSKKSAFLSWCNVVCLSRIVAFIKKYPCIIFLTCFIFQLDSSHVEI